MKHRSVCLVAWPAIVLVLLAPRDALFADPPTSETTANASVNSAKKVDAPELRYRILERFREAFFCDPDAFPVGLSPVLARKRGLEIFPEIEQDKETFRAILHHLGVGETGTLSDEQKLLVYGEFKRLRGAVHLEGSNDPFRFNVGLKEKTGDTSVQGLVDRHGTITILKRESTFLTCPLCLAAGTRIDTPDGWIPVQNVKSGDKVWTLDATGHRACVPVLKTSATPLSFPHRVVHLILGDGRELWASPGHPTADGRTIGQLEANGTYDGSPITSAELIPYQEHQVYDLLPAGNTGFYWANGILVASTLRRTVSRDTGTVPGNDRN
jgi:Hint domain